MQLFASFVTAIAILGAEPIDPPRMCIPGVWTPSAQETDKELLLRYQLANRVDWVKSTRVTRVGKKKRTTVTYRESPYGWKDPVAAERLGMTLHAYVIGGAESGFKLRLYCLIAAAVDAGHKAVITSLFRDDYRQSIAEGNRAAPTNSYHGGSRRGGYGHGRAADISSRGTLEEKKALWKWIDEHGKEFGLGRPYGDHDPPHVAPIDGQEYLAHHGVGKTRLAKAKNKKHRLAEHSRYIKKKQKGA